MKIYSLKATFILSVILVFASLGLLFMKNNEHELALRWIVGTLCFVNVCLITYRMSKS